jgi:hypothetical protein
VYNKRVESDSLCQKWNAIPARERTRRDQKSLGKQKFVETVLCFLLISNAACGESVSGLVLPRSVGPFTLGMSEESFRKVSGESPSFCHWCVTGELNAKNPSGSDTNFR